MKPCDICGNEVTQRWRLSTQSRMPHDPSRHTANNAALELLQTKVCDRLCTEEPATINRDRTTDAGFLRKCLQRHLHGNVAAYACYKCALPAIREASCIAAETQSVGQYTRPTTREVDLTNYHAICRGDIRATNTILETPQTRIEATDLDPWGRQKARGTQPTSGTLTNAWHGRTRRSNKLLYAWIYTPTDNASADCSGSHQMECTPPEKARKQQLHAPNS